MQQPGPMFQVTPSFPSANITTEQIQKISAICNPHRQSPLPCATYQPFSGNFFMACGEPSLCSQCGHRILKRLIKQFQMLDSFAKCTKLKRFSSSILNAVKREHHECWYKQNVVQYARRFKTGCELRYSPSSGGHFNFSKPRRSGSDYLDENKKLILAILDNQNLGKLAECAQYQAQLQKNLMYLAAIADAQPQTLSSSMPPPMTPNNVLQQGGLYMPHPQAVGMAQQPGTFAQRAPFSTPHPMQDPRHQLPQQVHPQSTQGLMAMWPVGATNGTNPMHKNANLGGFNSSLPALNPGNNPDKPESGATPKSDVQ